MIVWRSDPAGDERRVRFARALRELLEQVAEANDADGVTLTAIADTLGIRTSALSEAASGRRLLSLEHLDRILSVIEASDEERADWHRRHREAQDPDVDASRTVERLRSSARAWDSFPPDQMLDYRAMKRLAGIDELTSLLPAVRNGLLSNDPDADLILTWLVASAIQHGVHYRRWFDLAGPTPSAIEAALDLMLTGEALPRIRAAWLLQELTEDLRSGASHLLVDLAEATDLLTPELDVLIGAFVDQAVEHWVRNESAIESALRDQLLKEFLTQGKTPSARGRLLDYVQNRPDGTPNERVAMSKSQLDKTARDFTFVANRLILTLAGEPPGDRNETVAQIAEGFKNRLADVVRSFSPHSQVTRIARQLAEVLGPAIASQSLEPGDRSVADAYLDEFNVQIGRRFAYC